MKNPRIEDFFAPDFRGIRSTRQMRCVLARANAQFGGVIRGTRMEPQMHTDQHRLEPQISQIAQMQDRISPFCEIGAICGFQEARVHLCPSV
jgi:hypothetical protein